MDLWVFDNDGTLYDDFGAGEKFMRILFQYAAKLLGISVTDVPERIKSLKEKWKTEFSILALTKEYNIDFSEIVRDTYLKLRLEECGIPRPDLIRKGVLDSISSRKIVFTNNPSFFARFVLSYIGLADCFSDFVGMEETSFCEKPNPMAYRAVENRHGGFNRIIFCDDSLKNLQTAHELGWVTIWCKPPNIEGELGKKHFVANSFEEILRFS